MWVGLLILIAIILIVIALYKIRQWIVRRAQAAAMERTTNFRMSTFDADDQSQLKVENSMNSKM